MFRKIIIFTLLALVGQAHAQAPADAYPSKPIRMIVPFPPAGGTDILARLIASKLSEQHKWVMVIEKAWAQLHGGYDEISGRKMSGYGEVFESVTGSKSEELEVSDLSPAALTQRLEAAWAAKQIVEFASTRDGDDTQMRNGVRQNHAYALNGVSGGRFNLYNPLRNEHGEWEHLQNVDAAFIIENFETIVIGKGR